MDLKTVFSIDIIKGMNVIGQLRKGQPTMKAEASEECNVP